MESILKICLLILPGNLLAQNIQLTGTVLNKETKTPVSLASIFTKDNKYGTVSATDGKFSLRIPAPQTNTYLYFSSIGYETDSLLISSANVSSTINLIPKNYTLKEVIVMPESTLLTLLRTAYSKIPENYPQQSTRYKGFYQESTSDSENNLIKLVEAELSVYKESYLSKKEAPGQIEILKSRIKQFQSMNAGYAGGAFLPVNGDVVLQRDKFIQPQYLKNYRYELTGIKTWKETDCYEITFYSLDKDSVMQGTMLIDVESLAYISFEIISERPENAKTLIGGIRPVEVKRKTEYEQINGVWYLKQASAKTKHEHWRMKNPQYSSCDFITTQIQTDSVRPVPVAQRLNYLEPIEVISEAYNPKGWTDFDIIAGENPEQLRFQFSTDEAYSIFNQNVRFKQTFAGTLLKTMPKLIAGYGVYYNSNNNLAVFQQIIGYRFNKKWSVQWLQSGNLYDTKRISLQETSLGVEYRKNLNNAGYPLFLETSLWVSHNRIKRKHLADFREQTIAPQLSLTKQMSRRYTIEIFAKYPVAVFFNSDNSYTHHLRAGFNLYFLY